MDTNKTYEMYKSDRYNAIICCFFAYKHTVPAIIDRLFSGKWSVFDSVGFYLNAFLFRQVGDLRT